MILSNLIQYILWILYVKDIMNLVISLVNNIGFEKVESIKNGKHKNGNYIMVSVFKKVRNTKSKVECQEIIKISRWVNVLNWIVVNGFQKVYLPNQINTYQIKIQKLL